MQKYFCAIAKISLLDFSGEAVPKNACNSRNDSLVKIAKANFLWLDSIESLSLLNNKSKFFAHCNDELDKIKSKSSLKS